MIGTIVCAVIINNLATSIHRMTRIRNAIEAAGGEIVLTSPSHACLTWLPEDIREAVAQDVVELVVSTRSLPPRDGRVLLGNLLRDLEGLSSLTRLHVSTTILETSDVQSIAKMPRVEALTLGCKQLDRDVDLSQLRNCTYLSELKIWGATLNDDHAIQIKELQQLAFLQIALGDTFNLKCIESLSHLTSLKSLYLHAKCPCVITYDDVTKIYGMRSLETFSTSFMISSNAESLLEMRLWKRLEYTDSTGEGVYRRSVEGVPRQAASVPFKEDTSNTRPAE